MTSFNHEGKKWITIDPGVVATGIAFWEDRNLRNAITLKSSYKEWIDRSMALADMVRCDVERFSPEMVFIEEPFTAIHSQQTIAAVTSNSIVKLSVNVGMYILVVNLESIGLELIKPRTWKGQLSDDMLKKRIVSWCEKENQKLPDKIEYLSEHAIDAIGMGLHVLKTL